jgi:type I restriction enzyme S subunit
MLTHRNATILGDIPEDWERELLINLLAEQKGGNWGEDTGDVPIRVLRSTNFTDHGTLDFTSVAVRYFNTAEAEKTYLKNKDLLLERSGGGPTQPVGRVGFITQELPRYWFSNFVQLLRPDAAKIDPEFLGWMLLEVNQSGIVERLQHQTTQMRNLDFRDYLRIFLPRPKPEEQKVIARTLRTANEAIAIVEAKLITARRLKTALMQQLFTRGIPGRHSTFKETKIGLIPNSWEVLPLGIPTTVFSGIALNTDREARFHPRRYLTVINVQRERLDMAEVRYMEVYPHEIPNALLEAGDIVVVEGHANASEIGRAALITEDAAGCAYQNHLFRLRLLPDSGLNRLFLLGVLNSERVRRHWVATCNTSSGLNTINHRGLRRLLIQRPAPDEQEEIETLLGTANDNIAACIAEVQSLNHLKRSLLQNLLTGRVRVRI